MRNLLYLIFSVCFLLFISGCTHDPTNASVFNDLKQECPKTDCRNDCKGCPDIEPYIEEHNEFWGSNTQMIYWANKTKESLYKRYDVLCQDIIENFKEDEDFIKTFKDDIKAFENYRDTQRKLLFPRKKGYGIMQEYPKWSSDYGLTVQHIEELKEKISTYCSYNSDFLKDESVCDDKNIDRIFNKVKLKSPKPVISTPYDKNPYLDNE